ncbi:hypothetical protein OH77DRAFT_1440721, partial [Trametes cingulata]
HNGRRAEQGAVKVVRRPPTLVAVNAISILNFSRSSCANLLPTTYGLMYFALSAPFDLFHIGSRIGLMPAYTTIYRDLERLGAHAAESVQALGRDAARCGVIWLDNVQNYLRQRDMRIGRENVLISGVAGTYVEAWECDPKALDLDDKRARVSQNLRRNLTVEQLIGFVDQQHRETVGMLQWLRVLTTYIPELRKYRTHVTKLYQTRGAVQQLPVRESQVHPLSTSGKSETVTTELKDVLLDFLMQTGQQADDYQRRLVMLGGDGLTYEKLHQLKNYLQFHEDEFESFEIVQPMLALWHTLWTDLSRLVETHWGPPRSEDPSTLGHSAQKIRRPTPANLKKVDFQAGSELVYLVLDARMLDCWRLHFACDDIFKYFQHLSEKNKIPSLEDLERVALTLYRAYSSYRAVERAAASVVERPGTQPSTTRASEWLKVVPAGTPWLGGDSNTLHPVPVLPTVSTDGTTCAHQAPAQQAEVGTPLLELKPGVAVAPSAGSSRDERGEAGLNPSVEGESGMLQPPSEPFQGDRTLANSIAFMRDALLSREFALAMADGDVGRVYQAMIAMLFTFAGSPHTKYMAYILETIIVERKGTEYNTPFVRNIVSRNLHHLSRLQDDLNAGLGLNARPGTHTEPHQRPELRILLQEYKSVELHSRRPGRGYSSLSKKPGVAARDPDDYRRGLQNLRSGKLQKWIKESSFLRSPRRSNLSPTLVSHSTLDSDTDTAVVPSDPPLSAGQAANTATLSPARGGPQPAPEVGEPSSVAIPLVNGSIAAEDDMRGNHELDTGNDNLCSDVESDSDNDSAPQDTDQDNDSDSDSDAASLHGDSSSGADESDPMSEHLISMHVHDGELIMGSLEALDGQEDDAEGSESECNSSDHASDIGFDDNSPDVTVD